MGAKPCRVQSGRQQVRVPSVCPVGRWGISEGEVAELHACTLLSCGGTYGTQARAQRLADLEGHLDDAPFQRVRQLLDQLQTLTIPERRHVGYA